MSRLGFAASSSIAIEDGGSEILAAATRINFTGDGVTVADGGGGQADVAIAGGGSDAFDWQRPDRSWAAWVPGGGGILHEFGTDWNFVGGNNTTASTDVSTRTKGFKFEVGNGTTTTAGWYSNGILYLPDGLKFEASWSFVRVGAGSTFFCGVADDLALPGAVEVSTLTNMVGIGFDSADSTLQIMSNDASGTATKHHDTGIGIEGTLSPRTKFLFGMDADIAASNLGWSLTTITGTGTRANYSGTISSDLPAATAILGAMLAHRNLSATTYGEGVSHGCRLSTKQ